MQATTRPIRPGSPEHRQQQRQLAQQAKEHRHQVERLIADARLLARRDDGRIDPAIEAPRLAVLDALFGFIDGEIPLAELQAISAPLQAELSRKPAQAMLQWLRATLPAA
jgi:hypothetical protein